MAARLDRWRAVAGSPTTCGCSPWRRNPGPRCGKRTCATWSRRPGGPDHRGRRHGRRPAGRHHLDPRAAAKGPPSTDAPTHGDHRRTDAPTHRRTDAPTHRRTENYLRNCLELTRRFDLRGEGDAVADGVQVSSPGLDLAAVVYGCVALGRAGLDLAFAWRWCHRRRRTGRRGRVGTCGSGRVGRWPGASR